MIKKEEQSEIESAESFGSSIKNDEKSEKKEVVKADDLIKNLYVKANTNIEERKENKQLK